MKWPVMIGRAGLPSPEDARVFSRLYGCGVRMLKVDATCSEDIYHPQLRAWLEPGTFCYDAQVAYWQRLLDDCPDAQLCLRLYVASPPWWDEQHPDELQQYADGTVHGTFRHTQRSTIPSLASSAWRAAAVDALTRFLNWLDDSGWGQRVWGIFPSYGITWEWGILGGDGMPDYSPPMQRYFRAWLQRQYGDEETLRRAWGIDDVTFDGAKIPSADARLRGDDDMRVFPRDRPAYDFQRCLSDANADYLLLLAETIRAKVGARYCIGSFYGYTVSARLHDSFACQVGAGGLQGGHHSLSRVLRSGALDVVASPYLYADRELGTGTLIQHYPLRSVQLHGVQGYDENDLRTFTYEQPPIPISVGATTTRADSIAHQRLALAQSICRGTQAWWYDLAEAGESNFTDAELLAELSELVVKSEAARGDSVAEIAILIDEAAVDALALGSDLFMREVYQQLSHWAWCAAPFDVWLTSDASQETMAQYRLVYVFAPYLSSASARHLTEAVCHSGRTVWWGPWTGAMSDSGHDDEAFAKLTGFQQPEQCQWPLARCGFEDWTSLYGLAAGVPAEALAALAEQAGVRLYGTAPLHVMASTRHVAIHTGEAPTALSLPDGRWRDAFSGETLQPGQVWDAKQCAVYLFARDADVED